MPNERKLTKSELKKREDIVMDMKKNKRELTKRYGKDAEAVMYGRATRLAKQKSESMNPDKIREMIKSSLKNPKKADLNKDGKLSSYEEKRGAAIEKSMVKEWGSSDQYAMNQSIHRDLGNPTKFPGLSQIMSAAEDAVDFYGDDWEEYQTDRDGLIMSAARRYARKYFPEFMAMAAKMMEPIIEKSMKEMEVNDPILVKMRAAAAKDEKPDFGKEYGEAVQKAYNSSNLAKLNFLRKERSQLMRDMEQEAEPEGGPIADEYGAKLNRIDKAIAKLSGRKEMTYDQAIAEATRQYLGMSSSVSKRRAKSALMNPSNDGSKVYGLDKDGKRVHIKSINDVDKFKKFELDADLNEDIDLGHQDNEPGMIKAQLYHIGSYAMELYKMMDDLEDMGEIDFPSWWQSKITTAENMIAGAKHYLEFELKEPAIDAFVSMSDELEEVTRYSGFIRNPEDPDSEQFDPTWEVKQFQADLRRLFGKFKGELNNPEFIKGVAQIMVNWKSLLRSQLEEELYTPNEMGDMAVEKESASGAFESISEVEDDMNKKAEELIKDTLSKEGGAAGLKPLIKAVKGLGLNKDEVVALLKKMGKVKLHKDGDYILFPVEEDRKAVEYIKSIEDEDEREEERKRMFDDEKESLKEYTDNNFKGSEIISNVTSPDMFAKKAIEDLFPSGVASEGDAIEALKAHDASPIKARMGRFAPMFVHVQYHDFESGGEEYRAYQTQYYNSNFKDTDPTFNPKVTKLVVDKMVDGEGEQIGTILVKTDEYLKDLKGLNIIKKAM